MARQIRKRRGDGERLVKPLLEMMKKKKKKKKRQPDHSLLEPDDALALALGLHVELSELLLLERALDLFLSLPVGLHVYRYARCKHIIGTYRATMMRLGGLVFAQTFRASLICCFLARFSSLVSSFLRAWPRLTAGCSSLCVR